MVTEFRFADAESLASALASRVADELRTACRDRSAASLVVSGGKSPVRFLETLSRCPLAWDQVSVTLADERWVDPASPDSNEALIRRHLLQGAARSARFVPLKNDAPTPTDGEPVCEAALATLPRPFDLVVLGMGEDGHTASLFPQAPQLRAALESPRLCLGVDPVTAPHPRMSLTLRALLSSRLLLLQISGKKKWDVYRRAFRIGPVEECPIRAIIQQREVPVDVYWSA